MDYCFSFSISLLSLGVYRDIVDLFTALLRSYSDNSFIAIYIFNFGGKYFIFI